MIRPLFNVLARGLIAILPKPSNARDGQWRSLHDEKMIQPFGAVYEGAGFTRNERFLHRFVRLWVPFMGRPEKKTIRTGEVSGVYYPID